MDGKEKQVCCFGEKVKMKGPNAQEKGWVSKQTYKTPHIFSCNNESVDVKKKHQCKSFYALYIFEVVYILL